MALIAANIPERNTPDFRTLTAAAIMVEQKDGQTTVSIKPGSPEAIAAAAAAGAVAGGIIGSVIPGVGNVAGAAVGTAAGAIVGFIFG